MKAVGLLTVRSRKRTRRLVASRRAPNKKVISLRRIPLRRSAQRSPTLFEKEERSKSSRREGRETRVLDKRGVLEEEMPVLTCNACNKEFEDEGEQKLHYRSEWHRYNLKRKVYASILHFFSFLYFFPFSPPLLIWKRLGHARFDGFEGWSGDQSDPFLLLVFSLRN